MHKIDIKIHHVLLAVCLLLLIGILTAAAQETRWIRVGQLQCFFRDDGIEQELAPSDFLIWPAQYSDEQHCARAKQLWIGARNFYDPFEQKTKSVKVIGTGPRLSTNLYTMVFPKSIKLIGKYQHPTVVVDDQIGTSNTLYDQLDELDENLPCDRMVVITFNTSMGVSVTKKIMAFTQPNHDSYFIYDFVFKNTGIYNAAGDVYQQTLEPFWAHFAYRYAEAGVTSSGFGSTWGAFSSEWGASQLFTDFGLYNGSQMRGFYSWYGPNGDRPVTFAQDWGCPNDKEDNGILGSAKYLGCVTLHADKSPQDPSDDPAQPKTTSYMSADHTVTGATVSQYDENFMEQRWRFMTEGHLPQTQVQEVGEGHYVSDLATTDPDRNGGGGSQQGQGFGPYTLAYGDSIHIVFAEGVSGISWEKCREVGANWFAYFTGTGSPAMTMPDGSPQSDPDAYKRAWCETGADSIMQLYRNAQANYTSGYTIPNAPPAPKEFKIASGGDRIRLSWADNADSYPHFDGYVIYRSEGNVKDYRTVYKKIFECNAANVVHSFDDITAARGFNYYYYIQAKDDGSQNDVVPGRPLYSSMFLTLTSVEAYLRRPAGTAMENVRVVPNPYDMRSRKWQFGDKSTYDRIAFYGLPPQCSVKIFTERGDLIWQKNHTDGSGDELWDSMTSSGQIVVSGIYILYVEATNDITDETTGTTLFHAGDSVYRKFVIIR
jgi:hypothetical protein